MTREEIAARLASCEESFRRAQAGSCRVRYLAALKALREVECLTLAVLSSS